MKHTQKKKPSYKRTAVSIVIISAITGGLVLLEDYRNEKEVSQFSEKLSNYQLPEKTHPEMTNSLINVNTLETNKSAVKSINDLAYVNSPLPSSKSIKVNKETDNLINNMQLTHVEQSNNENQVKTTQSFEAVDVLFGLSSSIISPEYKLALTKAAEHIKEGDGTKIWQIIGHTDKSGHALYNLQLAKKRAQNVTLFLIEQGVDEKQLKLVTLGEYEAAKLENSTYNKGLRRVEVVEYAPEINTLAVRLEKRYQIFEKQRLHKEQLVRAEKAKIKSSNQVDISEHESVQFNSEDKNSNKTTMAQGQIPKAQVGNQNTTNLSATITADSLVNPINYSL